MAAQTYDIFFSGRTLDGADTSEVKRNLAKIFNMDDKQLEYLFAGSPVKVKGDVDQETAIKYRVAFRNAGALVEIQSTGSAAAADKTRPARSDSHSTASAGMTLLPPNTGSLIDCAPKIEPAALPDISQLTLANPGTLLDETPAPEAEPIDTSYLELAPANSGSLEEYQIRKEPAPLPDISQLSIMDNDN